MFLRHDDIINLCMTNTHFYCIVFNDDKFWKNKFTLTYNKSVGFNVQNWRLLYFNMMNVWVSGTHEKQIRGKAISMGNIQTGIIDFKDRVWISIRESNLKINQTKYEMLKNIRAKQISCGGINTGIIDINNNVWLYTIDISSEFDGSNLHIKEKSIISQIPNIKAKQICLSGDSYGFGAFIDCDNRVWILGNIFTDGSIGIAKKGLRDNLGLSPTMLENIKAKQISCGYRHLLIIDMDNNIWSIGYNKYGQLGLGDNRDRSIPTQIPNIKAKQLATGMAHHSMIIDMDDNVWVWGYNLYGQLGIGHNNDINIPIIIPNLKATQISISYRTSIILDQNNNIWKSNRSDGKAIYKFSMIDGIKAMYICNCINSNGFIGNKISY